MLYFLEIDLEISLILLRSMRSCNEKGTLLTMSVFPLRMKNPRKKETLTIWYAYPFSPFQFHLFCWSFFILKPSAVGGGTSESKELISGFSSINSDPLHGRKVSLSVMVNSDGPSTRIVHDTEGLP